MSQSVRQSVGRSVGQSFRRCSCHFNSWPLCLRVCARCVCVTFCIFACVLVDCHVADVIHVRTAVINKDSLARVVVVVIVAVVVKAWTDY